MNFVLSALKGVTMGKIITEYETKYNVGDVVVFEKNGTLEVGVIEGYYVEDHVFWFNIRISPTIVYTYTNGGDIGEHDIIGKIESELRDECCRVIGIKST